MSKKKSKTRTSSLNARRPIADKVIRVLRSAKAAKVVDLSAVRAGHKHASALQETVVRSEDLADSHPAHALYVYAQNQTSVMSEQLTALFEMERFARLVGEAEEEYSPVGPPMSPLTVSFFSSWAFFDACVGVANETLATTVMAVLDTFGDNDELVRVIGLMQDSRMAVYAHEGLEGGTVVLRELVTNRVCRAISTSGYIGRAGELWYARVLPPPLPPLSEHIVFTTPYVLVEPSEREWLAYFDRSLPEGPTEKRLAAYERHMKWGPARDYWTEFVFEAYVNHRHEVIYLKGLPDVPESRPHARVNW